MSFVKLGVAFAWHHLAWPELLAVVRKAEALGFQAAFVDGDVSQLPSRGDHDILDGWTATAALLAKTERIEIGSIRLVYHWNAARLAQAVATLERIEPGRLRFMISIGGQASDRRFGFPKLGAGERIHWLEETLHVIRGLWKGERVSFDGRYVNVSGAQVRPTPAGGAVPIQIAARGRRLLEVVAKHGDRWDINVPPIPERVATPVAHLERACRKIGRDPASIDRSMWIFTRVGQDATDPALHAEFRRLNPWFSDVPDADLPRAVVAGSPEACRARLEQIREELSLALPVVDCPDFPSKKPHANSTGSRPSPPSELGSVHVRTRLSVGEFRPADDTEHHQGLDDHQRRCVHPSRALSPACRSSSRRRRHCSGTEGYFWQPATYMWLHAPKSLAHIGFNMLALWMFGSPLASAWGDKRFLRFYLLCGIGAGLFIVTWPAFSGWFGGPNSPSYFMPTVGASGAVYGVLLAYSLTWPDRTIMLAVPADTDQSAVLHPVSVHHELLLRSAELEPRRPSGRRRHRLAPVSTPPRRRV